MKGEKLKKDATRLAEIVVRILQMNCPTFNFMMTVFGYMVMKVVVAVALQIGVEPDKEMELFIKYLNDIYAGSKKEPQQSADIIKMN